MTDISGATPHELNVTNFGPIAEGKIELRPMTVLVGPSNSGKSYFASLIYTLQRFFSSHFGGTGKSTTLPDELWAESTRTHWSRKGKLSKSNVPDLVSWFTETMSRQLTLEVTPSRGSIELPETVATLVRPILSDVADFSRPLDSEFARCYGVEQTQFLRSFHSAGNTEILFRGALLTEKGESQTFSYQVKLQDQGVALSSSIPSTANLYIERRLFEKQLKSHWLLSADWTLEEDLRGAGALKLLELLADCFASDIVAPLNQPPFYLPADRAGVMHSHQVVVRSLIASASRAALRPDSPLPVLSGVLGDFLDQLVALSSVSHLAHEDYDTISRRLEHSLLQGEINVGGPNQVNYPTFFYRPDGWDRDLPLMNTSSMVSELAPVVLYLRHVVQPGNLLIIEEPEAHLHPEMQAKFIRHLVSAVQSGVRILITTHSEWILEELANLVRLSELAPDQREGIEDPDISLSPNQLGAWLFEPSEESGGSVVREISLDEESATFPAGFGLVTENLYNRWVEISTRIQEN